MPTVEVYNAKHIEISKINLLDQIFKVTNKPHLLHEVVKWQLARRRSGCASAKTRAEVSGSGKKPWRQKGTGRARVGTKRSPLWRGGGVVHPPKVRTYDYALQKKVRKAAIRVALSNKLRENKLIVIRDFELSDMKTKIFIEKLNLFNINNALIITQNTNESLVRCSRNIHTIKVLSFIGLNVYDILRYDYLVFMEEAVKNIEEALI